MSCSSVVKLAAPALSLRSMIVMTWLEVCRQGKHCHPSLRILATQKLQHPYKAPES